MVICVEVRKKKNFLGECLGGAAFVAPDGLVPDSQVLQLLLFDFLSAPALLLPSPSLAD